MNVKVLSMQLVNSLPFSFKQENSQLLRTQIDKMFWTCTTVLHLIFVSSMSPR